MKFAYLPGMGPAALVMAALLLLPAAAANDWPRFRGPNGGGAAEPADFPSPWSDEHQLWQTVLPGEGHSSPVVWNDFLITQCADAENAAQWIVRINTSDGSIEWKKSFPHPTYPKHKRSSFAISTPAIDAEFIFAAWGSSEGCLLSALTHAGQVVWQQHLPPFYGRHGFGSSPTVVDDLVILTLIHGGEQSGHAADAESFVAAFDRRTGDLKWKLPRKNCTTSYSVPCVRQTPDGHSQLVACSTADGMYGVDLPSGRLAWSVPVFDLRVVSSPVIAGPLVLGTTGSGGGGSNYAVAVRPAGSDEPAGEVYRIRDGAPYVPTPVVSGELAFLWSDKGVVSCIRTADGERVFRRRVGGSYSASPILVGDRIFAISDDGEVVAIAASAKFEILGRNQLGELSRATPAAAGGKLFLRTLTQMTCIGNPPSSHAPASPAGEAPPVSEERAVAEPKKTKLAAAIAALRSRDVERAKVLTDELLEQDADDVTALALRVEARNQQGCLAEALADCDRLIELAPRQASYWDLRGSVRFKLGDIAGSLTDFDHAIELQPARAQRHWQRGISCYYLGRFKDGMEQFEKYQTYDGSDVENVVWKFLCEARYKDVATARQNMMRLTADDRRIPMMKVDALFRGSAQPADVLAAAASGSSDEPDRRYREFYAHLYLGLHYEAIGEPELARKQILAAAALPNDHYMWHVANVHAARLVEADRKEGGSGSAAQP